MGWLGKNRGLPLAESCEQGTTVSGVAAPSCSGPSYAALSAVSPSHHSDGGYGRRDVMRIIFSL